MRRACPHLEARHAQHAVAVVRQLRRVGVDRAAARLEALTLSGATLQSVCLLKLCVCASCMHACMHVRTKVHACIKMYACLRGLLQRFQSRMRARMALHGASTTHLVAVVRVAGAAADALARAQLRHRQLGKQALRVCAVVVSAILGYLQCGDTSTAVTCSRAL